MRLREKNFFYHPERRAGSHLPKLARCGAALQNISY
jgi:hypothetical protein